MKKKIVFVTLAASQVSTSLRLDFIPDEVIVRNIASQPEESKNAGSLERVECTAIESEGPIVYYTAGCNSAYELKYLLGKQLVGNITFRKSAAFNEVVVLTLEFVKHKPVLGQN